jgi:hypothetical protein
MSGLLLAWSMKSGSLVVIAEPIVPITKCRSFGVVAVAHPFAKNGVAEPIVAIAERRSLGAVAEPIVLIAKCRSFGAVMKPFAKDRVAEPMVPITECRSLVAIPKDGVVEPIVLTECRSFGVVTEPIASVVVASCRLVSGSAGRHLVIGSVWHLVIGGVRLVIGHALG